MNLSCPLPGLIKKIIQIKRVLLVSIVDLCAALAYFVTDKPSALKNAMLLTKKLF